MKTLSLEEVRRHTGTELSFEEACSFANASDPFLRNMAVALSLHSWNNTPEEWRRLEAALVILKERHQ